MKMKTEPTFEYLINLDISVFELPLSSKSLYTKEINKTCFEEQISLLLMCKSFLFNN